MNRQEAFDFVALELDWQNEKWGRADGDWPSTHLRKLCILVEEVGECADALNEDDFNNLKEELADVAASAIAWLMADYASSVES